MLKKQCLYKIYDVLLVPTTSGMVYNIIMMIEWYIYKKK